MDFDEVRAVQKRQEIIDAVREALDRHVAAANGTIATLIADSFAHVTPPEAPPVTVGFIRLHEGGIGGGRSTKPGNVRLNMRKLVIAASGSALTMAGAAAPWMVLLGGLVVWDSLWSAAEVELSETEAAVLWAMWINRSDCDTVPRASIAILVNSEIAKVGQPSLTNAQIEIALSKLRQLGCIEIAHDPPGSYWLREWVQIDYR